MPEQPVITMEMILFAIAGLFFVVAIGLFMVIFLMRNRSITRQGYLDEFSAFWTPILEQCFWGSLPSNLPTHVPKEDLLAFLDLWNNYQELFEGNNEKLNELALHLQIEQELEELILQGDTRQRIAAILTAGYLRQEKLWNLLSELTESENVIISLTAARALVQIDAKKSMPQLIPLIETRQEWPRSRVAHFLLEAGQEAISKPLAQAAMNATAVRRPQLIRYLEVTAYEEAMPALKKIILNSDDVETLCACLFVLTNIGQPDDVILARPFLDHNDWRVRVRAVTALGRLGSASDAEQLAAQLKHPQWWVRYRSAQALASLPSMEETHLLTLSKTLTDHYGSDAVSQVIAENKLNV